MSVPLKQRQRTKINKIMLSAPLPSSPYPFHLTGNELGPPVLESSARISKFYAPTDSEHKFNETEIENWLPIRYNLGSS